ncbi:MAG: flagellar biogenesis protein [Clostridia bacterium]|nr:flagellar biogenesis protein [Clostridia bacterium]
MPKNKERRPQAAALKYDPQTSDAPIIAALGVGTIAEKIIESAKENDIPVVENEALSDVLATLSVGDAIPPQLYEAVAQILVYISKQDENFYKKMRF